MALLLLLLQLMLVVVWDVLVGVPYSAEQQRLTAVSVRAAVFAVAAPRVLVEFALLLSVPAQAVESCFAALSFLQERPYLLLASPPSLPVSPILASEPWQLEK